MDIQRKSFDSPYLTSRRPPHHLHSFFSKQDESKELQALNQQIEALQKQLRDQNAEFVKQKAVLEQQVHLLTQQLSIEQERCKNLKKNYSAALAAFKQKKRNSSGSSSPKQRLGKNQSSNFSQSPRSSLMDNSNLSRQQAQQNLKKSFSNQHNRSSSFVLNSYLPKADPWSAKKIDLLQKDNKDLQITIKRLEELLQATKEQSKNQNSLMYHKEQEILQLQANIIEYETKLKTNTESKIQSVVKHESLQTKKLEQEIKKLKDGQERKIAQSIEEYQARNVLLNDQIIDYQTQIKNLNSEINTHLSRLNMKEQSFRALEQQIVIYETQLQNIQKEHSKVVEDYEIKLQTIDKEHVQVHNVLRRLREQYDKDSSNRKLPKKFSAMVNSSIDNMFCQSNNVTENPPPEETIKFASSANNSTHQFETSLQHDRESNLNCQRNILTTEALGNASTIPVDRVFSELSKSNLEIQTCIAQVHILSKEKQAIMKLINHEGHRHKSSHDEAIQVNRNMELVNKEPEDLSLEIKDRDGVGISPIFRGQVSHTFNSIIDQEIISREKEDHEYLHQNQMGIKKQNRGTDRKPGGKVKSDQRSPHFNDKPLKLSSYWANEEQFRDDGSCSLENVNGLRRQIANLRNKRNKLLVKFNNLKHDSLKEIKRLERQVANMQHLLKQEKDKRVDVQLQKIEQSSTLYEAINEKSSKINQLKQKLIEVETEKDELQSISQNYLGLGVRLSVDQGQYQNAISGINKIKGRDFEQISVYQSQQLYNLKGMPKSANRQLSKTYGSKRHSDNGNLGIKSLNNLNIEEIRQKLMEESDQNQGAMTQRPPSRDTASKQMKKYMTERPCIETNSNNDFNPLINQEICSPPVQIRDAIDSNQFKQFQTSINKRISFQEQILENERLSDEEDLKLKKIEKAQKINDQKSPEQESRQQLVMPRSPVSFFQQNHLGQSRMLTIKSLESQQQNITHNTFSVKKTTSASKPPNGILKKSMAQQQDDSSRNALLIGRPLQQNIHSYNSPENRQSPIRYFDNQSQSEQIPIDMNKFTNENENNVFDASCVNIMSPPGDQSSRKDNRSPPVHQFKGSIQNQIIPQTVRQSQNQHQKAEAFNDVLSNDSEKDLDVGQENQGENLRLIQQAQGHQFNLQQSKKEPVPALNLQYNPKANMPQTTVNQYNNKNIFYSEISKNRLQKVQSPLNNNNKQFLCQTSDLKQQRQLNLPQQQQQQPQIKAQIHSKPKIQNYLTQNLPLSQQKSPQSFSDRKPKGVPAEHLIKKTLVSKNLADRSNFQNHSNLNQGFMPANDHVVYTARAGIKAYVSPKNIMENARCGNNKHQNESEHKINKSQDPCDQSSKQPAKPQNYYNKATSYLSSKKMTPNTTSIMADNHINSSSFGVVFSSDQKNSNSHFAGPTNQRALNSFFSQNSNLSASLKQGSGTPSTQQRIGAPYNVMTEESTSQNQKMQLNKQKQHQHYLVSQQNSSDLRKKMFATGRLSKQSSNTSYDSNMSQTIRQSSSQKQHGNQIAGGSTATNTSNRQSTAQQMYQAYKNKYLNKK